jgi:hypothetical protein
MNLNANPTADELRQLLRQCNDKAGHHLLWVDRSGEVRISRIPLDRSPVPIEQDYPDMQMRCETFVAGNGYVGPSAADDEEWVAELLGLLMREWPKAKGKPGVTCTERF